MWTAVLAGVLAVAALAVALTGGVDVRIAGVRIRARSWVRPAIPALIGCALVIWMTRVRVGALLARAWRIADTPGATRILTFTAIAWCGAASLAFSTAAAGGSDSYGYVSQARSLARGRLTEPITLPRNWPAAEAALVPLAYTRGTWPGVIVPTYPPGLSLLMVPLTVFGERAVYLIVPAFGMLALWLTFRIGAALGDPFAGAVAALLLSVSPAFLCQVFQPMSDVPAAACWLAALLLSARGSVRGAAGAGAMTGLAILVRPNLAPLGALLLVAIACSERPARWRRAVAFGCACAPALMVLAGIQHVRYGSPLASGYASFGTLFSLGNVGPNLDRYPRWLTETETPFIWLSALCPLWLARCAADRRLAWTAIAFCLGIWGSYLPYGYFSLDEWSYTRFLLPAIPLMLVFAAAVSLWAVRRLPVPLRPVLTVLLVTSLVPVLLRSSQTRGVFALHTVEQKYPLAGRFVRDHLPASSVIVALQHSGSVRYYADRLTLRWDLLEAGRLDETLAALQARGYAAYAVLDEGEDAEFRRRFQGQRAIARLSPLVVFGTTRVYPLAGQ